MMFARAAMTSLASLLFKNPVQVPRIVQLLRESYNPHVRCGATLAWVLLAQAPVFKMLLKFLSP